MAQTIPAADAVFLWADRPEAPANVGVLLVFEPPPGRSAAAAAREIVRAYRATPPTAPFDAVPDTTSFGLPRWRMPERIDLREHVLHETLTAPGDAACLSARVVDLHRDRLDRSRPLFEIHLIDGLESGRFALYVKSHHVSWDGQSALARIFSTFTTSPGPLRTGFHAAPPAAPPADATAPGSPLQSILARGLVLRELYSTVTKRLAERRACPDVPQGNAPFAGPRTRLNQPVVADRSFATFSLSLADLRRVGKAHGGTVNDALLAILDEAVHHYLQDAGEPAAEPLVAMCPLSLREPGDAEAATKATSLFVRLGEPRAGPARRISQIVASSARAKAELRSMSKEASLDFALLAFGSWLASHALGLDPYTRPVVNYTVSNVGGIDGPRYLGRSRLVEAYPVSMLADPVGLNFTCLSHDGRLDVGVIASRAAVPDAAPLVRHCLAAWRRLRAARPPQALTTGRSAPERKRSRTRRMPATQRS